MQPNKKGPLRFALRSLLRPGKWANRAALEANRQRVAMAPNWFVLVGRFAPTESVVHAHQDSGRFRMGAEGATRGDPTGPSKTGAEYSMAVVAEVHVVAFQKRRPAPREHPFNATTGRPACSGPIEAAKVNSINGELCALIKPGHTALAVEQPGRCKRIADAARQGVEPTTVIVERDNITESICESSIPTQACPIKHVADADHPSARELIIAANLTAASKARPLV